MIQGVEAIIILLLLFMTVPDVCRKLRRPALTYSAYVLFGMALRPWLTDEVATMLTEAGSVGFLLLLFEVGMEIELPRIIRMIRPVRNAIAMAALQAPVVLAITQFAGFELKNAFMAAAALTGCSVGMAHAAWKAYPGLNELARLRILRTMVALELWTILTLVLGSATIKDARHSHLGLTIVAIVALVFLIGRFGTKLVPVFEWIITRTTHWRVHLLVLLILVVCILGEYVGLGGPKTAFFLGMAMSQTRHRGMHVDDYMAPISQRFLIPIFFVALGLRINWLDAVSLPGLLAFGTAGLLLGMRMIIHNRILRIGGDKYAFLLLAPNLTMVALGATALLDYAHAEAVATWLLLTGLFMTIPAILFLPPANATSSHSATAPGPASPSTPLVPGASSVQVATPAASSLPAPNIPSAPLSTASQ
jgi:Kef-type K+ transport system membrane component KefB